MGQTFLGTKTKAIEQHQGSVGYQSASFGYKPGVITELNQDRKQLQEQVAAAAGVEEYREDQFYEANWCYDTPGIVHSSQVKPNCLC